MRSYGPATTKPAQAVQARPEPTPAPAGPAPKKTKKKKKKRSLASMALPPILIIAAAVAAAIFLVSFYFMDGTSMGDTLRPGDALLSVHTDFSRLSQGDIISYDLEGKGRVERPRASTTWSSRTSSPPGGCSSWATTGRTRSTAGRCRQAASRPTR